MHDRTTQVVADLLRSRFDISHARAQKVLDAHEGDAVAAMAELEREERRQSWSPSTDDDELLVAGPDLVETLCELVTTRDIERIIVRDRSGADRLNLRVGGRRDAAFAMPLLAALGTPEVGAMQYRIYVEWKGIR